MASTESKAKILHKLSPFTSIQQKELKSKLAQYVKLAPLYSTSISSRSERMIRKLTRRILFFCQSLDEAPRTSGHLLSAMLARASALARRSASLSRSAHTMSNDAYTRSPESFTKVLDTFKKYRACAVLRTPKLEQCAPAMEAAIDGGFEIVEFTLTTPGCLDRVADFRAKYDGKVMVGCGTVMDIDDAKKAMDAGSEFLVAPVLVPEVVTWCAMHNIVIIPGCQTPTEAYTAYKAGAPMQKIFPGVAGGHMWVKAVSAALPMLTLNPTVRAACTY